VVTLERRYGPRRLRDDDDDRCMLLLGFSRRCIPGLGLALGVPVTYGMKFGLEKLEVPVLPDSAWSYYHLF